MKNEKYYSINPTDGSLVDESYINSKVIVTEDIDIQDEEDMFLDDIAEACFKD